MSCWEIVCADVLRWAAEYEGLPFHALLCDPPYELKFMNKRWDGIGIAFQPSTWAALAEHLLPGGFIMAFASSRGWHRLACALEDAGLIIQPSIFNWHTRDVVEVPFCLGWATGQSFPKASRIDAKLDAKANKLKERRVIGPNPNARPNSGRTGGIMGEARGRVFNTELTAPATDLARAWEGHRYGGQILKNALEPIIVAQKPWTSPRLDCIVETGAGALNIDKARIGTTDNLGGGAEKHCSFQGKDGWGRPWMDDPEHQASHAQKIRANVQKAERLGRWPANFVLCHIAPDENGEGGCRRVGVKKVKGNGHHTHNREIGGNGIYGGGGNTGEDFGRAHADPDGLETIDDFRCVENCPVAKLDAQAGERKSGGDIRGHRPSDGVTGWIGKEYVTHKDSGGPSRFYYNADWSHEVAERIADADPVRYQAKAAKRERNQNLDDFYWRIDKTAPTGFARIDKDEWEALGLEEERIYEEAGKRVRLRAQGNIHSTVKPIALNKWLATLLAPPKEYAPRRLLVPFSGVSSEMLGALLSENWEEIVGVEINQDYVDIGEARMKFWQAKMRQDSAQMSLEL